MNHLEEAASSGPQDQLQMEHELASALRLQRLLAEISSRFVTRPAVEMNETIEEIQRSSRAAVLGEIAAALAHEINQPLTTILGNASQSMRNTPVGVRRILIQTSTCGDFVHVHARDHGHGIPTEHLDRIFEPFHTTRNDGLGMGLAICRRVADAHGGTLKAANHESGAVFTLTLPLSYLPSSSQSITTNKFV